MVGLHPEGERHLGSEIPVVLDLMVSDLQLPRAAAQINSLLVLGTRREKFSKPSAFRFLSAIADFFFVFVFVSNSEENCAFSNCRMRLTLTKA